MLAFVALVPTETQTSWYKIHDTIQSITSSCQTGHSQNLRVNFNQKVLCKCGLISTVTVKSVFMKLKWCSAAGQ